MKTKSKIKELKPKQLNIVAAGPAHTLNYTTQNVPITIPKGNKK